MSRTIKAEDLPYRRCVGIMVLNREGLVWAGRRIPIGNSEYDGSPQLWQMPQGGIDKGEEPEAAAWRELVCGCNANAKSGAARAHLTSSTARKRDAHRHSRTRLAWRTRATMALGDAEAQPNAASQTY